MPVNKENIQKAINVMQRVRDQERAFNMSSWQSSCVKYGQLHRDEKNLHECGMPACFGGWIAVSPEFHADGGNVIYGGKPVFFATPTEDIFRYGYIAIARWLGISTTLACKLCACSITDDNISNFYGKYTNNITAEDVIVVLKRLLETGSVYENPTNT